jgi:phage-related protein
VATKQTSTSKPRLSCRFYKTGSGSEPVREWLKSLEAEVRQQIGSDIQVVQWRWPIGKPQVDAFGRGLFEVRTSHYGNIYRVLFCIDGSTMVLLNGFVKKAQKTPKAELELARKRQKDVEDDL